MIKRSFIVPNVKKRGKIYGNIEIFDSKRLKGWVYNANENNVPCKLHFAIGGVEVLSLTPNKFRQDVSKKTGKLEVVGFELSLCSQHIRDAIFKALEKIFSQNLSIELDTKNNNLTCEIYIWGFHEKTDVIDKDNCVDKYEFTLPEEINSIKSLEGWCKYFDIDIESLRDVEGGDVGISPVGFVDKRAAKVIAFYLPQYHTFKENDKWWGPGFSEWTGVVTAEKQFDEHVFPNIPADLGFYDLRVRDTRLKQIELAKKYGIYGFCHYFYWFSGERLLNEPTELLLQDYESDIPFCLCWANEPWSRRWDGSESEVLMAQKHEAKTDLNIFIDLLPYFKDDRYIRVDGKPLLVIYRIGLMKDPIGFCEGLRSLAQKYGFPGLHLCAATTFGSGDGRQFGCDMAVEFPPHGVSADLLNVNSFKILNDFKGKIYDYVDLVSKYVSRNDPEYPYYPGVIPRWDNTARKGAASHIFHGSSPDLFGNYLRHAMRDTKVNNPNTPFVFLNSWNEWGEGAHIEPDARYGRQYLEAVKSATSWSIDCIYESSLDFEILLRENAMLSRELKLQNKLFKLNPAFHGFPVTLNNLEVTDYGEGHFYIDSAIGMKLVGNSIIVTNRSGILKGWAACKPGNGCPSNMITYLVFRHISSGEIHTIVLFERTKRADVQQHLGLSGDGNYFGFEANFSFEDIKCGTYCLEYYEFINGNVYGKMTQYEFVIL